MTLYAHTHRDLPREKWEVLYGPDSHSELICRFADRCRNPFREDLFPNADKILRFLCEYHDMGKASKDFQTYLTDSGEGKPTASVNHKTAAAKFVMSGKQGVFQKMLAYVFEGHHSGLPNGNYLFSEVLTNYEIPDDVIEALPPHMRELPKLSLPMLAAGVKTRDEHIFAFHLCTRMLHSCLVDMDWLATEAFMSPQIAEKRSHVFDAIQAMSCRLEEYIGHHEQEAMGRIASLRRKIHEACYSAASKTPGVYRLNVPTGGGKTLSSLSFALSHASQHKMERVIYVIPYTSIIEQTASEFRKAVGANNVVEHHSNVDEANDTWANRLSSENWDAPLIVTTSVQFFESLFACKNKCCRKVHNIAHSVIIFDEAQSLPTDLLAPCLMVLKTLQRQYGCTILLCTATQPAWDYREGIFEIGWPQEEMHSLIGEEFEARLAREMKRVEVHQLGRLSQDKLIEHFMGQGVDSALFIVNLTRQAQELYDALAEQNVQGLYHLSARMCPAHRLDVLNEVRSRLKAGLPTVLVSTRVVEAGVDVSFPIVYRDRCGLDSLAQSAGRCNRHGESPLGRVYSYEAEGVQLPPSFVDLRDGIYAMTDTLATVPDADIFDPQTVEAYFRRFYYNRKGGTVGWDKPGILRQVGQEDYSKVEAWDFPEIANLFQFIPEGQHTLLVPYGGEVEQLRSKLLALSAEAGSISRQEFRDIQKFSVSVYEQEWKNLLDQNLLELVHKQAGIWMLIGDQCAYSQDIGLKHIVSLCDYVS